MERLTIDEIIEHCDRKTDMYEKVCDIKYLEKTTMNNPIKEYWEHKQVAEYLRKFKEYEDLEEQGRLIKLPCKIGDKVWHISGRDIKEDVISGIEYSYDGMFYIWSNEDTWLGGFNDIVFLTKSEAEAKLKELRGGENESSN